MSKYNMILALSLIVLAAWHARAENVGARLAEAAPPSQLNATQPPPMLPSATARAEAAAAAAAAATASSISVPATLASPTAAFTATELQAYAASLALVQNTQCRSDLNATFWGILRRADWATAMYDATVKSATGLQSAVLHQFGHFDECLRDPRQFSDRDRDRESERAGDDTTKKIVRAKYCLVDVVVDGITVLDVNSRANQTTTTTTTTTLRTARWGACVPASCEGADIAAHLSAWLQRRVLSGEHGVEHEPICQTRASNELRITKSMFAYACVLCFFVLLTLLSTMYHGFLLWGVDQTSESGGLKAAAAAAAATRHNETLVMALLSFSIIENIKKLFQASKDQLGLNSINGIKALAMLLILAGHALSFILGSSMYNAKFINEQLRVPTFSFLTNSLLFVDMFLLLSGFLFCRILLIELERRRGRLNVLVLYVARYIRLTPAYMAIIGFYMTWFPYVGSGPFWQQRIGLEQTRCQASWWLNILYINNYINTDNLCMFQSWYLSVDSQLFFIAPIVIFLLYRSRRRGLQFLVALAIITALVPFAFTYLSKLDPTLLVYADEVRDLAQNTFYVNTYIKTHMRASAYVIGLLVGYLVHLMQEKKTKLPSCLVRCLWLTAAIVGIASMYGVTRFYVSPYTQLESTLYAGFHKLGWNLAVGWLVLAVTTGHAGGLQRVLSTRFFAPISRLTYCAYLSNGIVELYHMASIRQPNYMGFLPLANDVFSHTLNTFLLAIVLCLLFESPIHALERILLRNFAGKEPRAAAHRAEKTGKETPSTSEEQVA